MKKRAATFAHERRLWNLGYDAVIGLDEVGRGSWAGPVTVAGVVFDSKNIPIVPLFDSKLLTPRDRTSLVDIIKQCARFFSVVDISVNIINREGIGKATQRGFRKAVRSLDLIEAFLLIDAFSIRWLPKRRQQPLKKGDRRCASIAAASILAKVHRDALMMSLHRDYPQYGFDQHKGYGTTLHQQRIAQYGLSSIHRTSFNIARTVAKWR